MKPTQPNWFNSDIFTCHSSNLSFP